MASLTLGSGRRQSGSRMPTTRPKVSVTGDKTKVRSSNHVPISMNFKSASLALFFSEHRQLL